MTTPSIKNPDALPQKRDSHHDVFFKEFYANPHFALELFHLVFSQKERLAFDWTKLKPEKDTFPDTRADLVFSVPLKHQPRVRFHICLLLEHKAQYSRRLFSQLLEYQCSLHKQTLQATGQPLPVISRSCFTMGKRPGTGASRFRMGYGARR